MRYENLGAGFLCACLIALGLSACSSHADKPVHTAFLQDTSDSQTVNCECLAATLATAPRSTKIGRGSLLLLYSTGSAQSALEPRYAGQLNWPAHRSAENHKTSERKQQAWVGQAAQVCQQFQPTTVTPLFLSVQTVIEQLQTTPLPDGARHTLYVKSDGEETVEPAVRAALADTRMPLHRLPRIDNHHVRVIFLGVADTLGQMTDGTGRRTANRTPEHAQRLKQVWQSVFTEPDAVSFVPHCQTSAKVGEVAQR